MEKVNLIYIIIWMVIIILFILISYCIVEFISWITNWPLISPVVRDAIDYIFGWKSPIMFFVNLVYLIINLRICHYIYIIFLCIVFFVLVIILILWYIGLIIQRIIFFNPFSNMSPWQELNGMGFFRWFFDRTDLEKSEDTQNFFIDTIKSALTPKEEEPPKEEITENFKNIEPTIIRTPSPHKEYIDYDMSKFIIEEKKNDIFYTESFKSIKQRELANYYRNMTIARPDTIGDFKLPNIDIEEMLNLHKSYLFI
jgi:hypothetical protein